MSLPAVPQLQALPHVSGCRAKAGGRQSAQDATGKFAKSAGSRIRRYNEVSVPTPAIAATKHAR